MDPAALHLREAALATRCRLQPGSRVLISKRREKDSHILNSGRLLPVTNWQPLIGVPAHVHPDAPVAFPHSFQGLQPRGQR